MPDKETGSRRHLNQTIETLPQRPPRITNETRKGSRLSKRAFRARVLAVREIRATTEPRRLVRRETQAERTRTEAAQRRIAELEEQLRRRTHGR